MDVKLISKKVFWPIFVIVFVIVALFIGKAIYNSQVEKVLLENSNQIISSDSSPENGVLEEQTFVCESNSEDIAYVYLHGFGDHNPGAFDYQRSLIGDKPVLDFDYDEKLSLEEIGNEFISQFNLFVSDLDVEEIVIIGQSAGGVIVASSASQLIFNGPIELHTLASPLNGYHIPRAFLGNLVGFAKEIALGFDSFNIPKSNVKSYHHKTINDEELESYCGDYRDFCNGLKVQKNNLAGAKEFFYDHTHSSIMHHVSKLIIDCHS